jgi:mannose-6-phosphate isomerase
MIPLKLTAPLKDYIWGGTRLREEYHKQSDLARLAEAWVLSCHPDGESVIANGPDAGLTLTEWMKQHGKSVLGSACARFEEFPILIKLIDAKENLSVQVHPDNDYARRVEGGYGKTEMWYILDCEEGAELIYGFRRSVTKEEFAAAIRENTLLELANRVPVKKGDVFFIEAGTLHAIGKGILIAEIQQNSNTTYRVYDYGRIGADGKPRPLHIEKALDVTSLDPVQRPSGAAAESPRQVLSSCEYFTVERCNIDGEMKLSAGADSFHSLLILDEGCSLHSPHGDLELQKGDSIFLEAGFGNYTIQGAGQVLLTYLK